MSVLKNKRNLSPYEYELSFNELYKYCRIQFAKIPKRRRSTLLNPLQDVIQRIHTNIMELSTGYVPYNTRAQWRYDLINQILYDIGTLQKPLFCYYNVLSVETKHMRQISVLANNLVALLEGMRSKSEFYNNNEVDEVKRIMYYKAEDISRVKFLSKMSELHQYVHGKAIYLQKSTLGYEAKLLLELVNNAWYHCLMANQKIPTTKLEYQYRRRHISDAISCLHKLNRPMLSVFCMAEYSNNVMKEWSALLTTEIRLLQALQSSDKKRFGRLN